MTVTHNAARVGGGHWCSTPRKKSVFIEAPIYVVDGVVHYCVTKMPSTVARSASHALNNVTLPHVLALAERGYRRALQDSPHLRAGLNVHEGCITHPAVAEGLNMPYVPPDRALGLGTKRRRA